MSRQLPLSDVAAQRTLTETTSAPTADSDEDRAQRHAADVATEHFPDLPIEAIAWDMSHRAKLQAGVTKYDPAMDEMTISLAWHAFEQQRWEQFSATVRHELIYTWQYYEYGGANHGVTFDRISQSGNLFSDAQVHYQSNKICKRVFRDR